MVQLPAQIHHHPIGNNVNKGPHIHVAPSQQKHYNAQGNIYEIGSHTREYVPFVAYGKNMGQGGELKNQDTFAVIGASVADNFGAVRMVGFRNSLPTENIIDLPYSNDV